MNNEEMAALEQSIEEMTQLARDFGLDFYPMRYEVCPSDVIYTFGAYGMPTRFSHWSFGKAFHRMKLEYDLGMSRIYELVINSDPCYAFLLDGNTLLQNKTVCAHVLAHCDFFKNNATFRYTSRDMVERMAASADRIRHYELKYGRQAVEELIDAGLALSEHVDASTDGRNARAKVKQQQYRSRHGEYDPVFHSVDHTRSPYDDLWSIGETAEAKQQKKPMVKARAAQKDIMLFVIEQSPVLEEWERDVLSILREEMLYFWPQMETKIMNEGWATYWHLRIMREMNLTDEEAVEFAKMHSGVVLPSRTSINPYHLGLAIWEDIEKRWNNPTEEERERHYREPGQGRAKMFEVREMENDVAFLRNYLTKQLIEDLDLYLYQKVGNDWRVVETDWEKVRDSLVASRVNGGIPVLYVEDGDYNRNGELFIKHEYEGVELDLKHLEKTMPYLYRVWGRNCHVQTVVEGRETIFSHDGKRTQRRFVKD
ncbi:MULTISPECIES: SpoVR family protein [Alicyclobacillus]|uniref:SpoVR family protein n=1 Tax=Alicyclobacillus acidoterrestris (strain ATCC 49025 / DSM 3922 / CIP 106132 / NCIMB 13137 / GD3B) TaxID=1356854 RepID=T0BGE1_ALIAG|nr:MULTISPECIES: SpoVR family protein [Alicyclobacillus]EPZ43028.1 stage V sporulation protein R [Alicyclobacillus acidoterrestris ATCC 49025]UNO49821.1 SpoVR family protein [Alicyclobacillus acidoterrestris]